MLQTPLIRSELFAELIDDIDSSPIRIKADRSYRDTPPSFGMRSRMVDCMDAIFQ